MNAKCYQCGQQFECQRNDAVFCSDKCRAQWVRDNERAAGKHVPLPDLESKFCEHCGTQFWYNAYAKRSGQRVPRFCSDKCRVASHRNKERAARESEAEARRNASSWDAFRERERQQQTPPPPPDDRMRDATGRPKDTYWRVLNVPRRWNHTDALVWLKSNYTDDWSTIVANYREIVRQLHPDANVGKTTDALKHINAAYDYLKRERKRSGMN
jgi:DnaJ-domain-containing protein 1